MKHFRPPPVTAAQPKYPGYFRQVWLMVQREASGKFLSVWFWIVATSISMIAYIYGGGFQHTFETESVVVTNDPLLGLNTMVTIFLGIVMGLRLAGGLSWEREHKTLEVLLVGPVSWWAVVISKYVAELIVLLALLCLYCLYLLIAQPLGGGVTAISDISSVFFTVPFVLPTMAFGLLVSSWALTVRAAVLVYLALVSVLCGYEALLGFLRQMAAGDMSMFALYLRATLEAVSPILEVLSPVSGIALLIQRAVNDDILVFAQFASVSVLAAALVVIARYVAQARGA